MGDHGAKAAEREPEEGENGQTFDEALERLVRLGLVLELGGGCYSLDPEL